MRVSTPVETATYELYEGGSEFRLFFLNADTDPTFTVHNWYGTKNKQMFEGCLLPEECRELLSGEPTVREGQTADRRERAGQRVARHTAQVLSSATSNKQWVPVTYRWL